MIRTTSTPPDKCLIFQRDGTGVAQRGFSGFDYDFAHPSGSGRPEGGGSWRINVDNVNFFGVATQLDPIPNPALESMVAAWNPTVPEDLVKGAAVATELEGEPDRVLISGLNENQGSGEAALALGSKTLGGLDHFLFDPDPARGLIQCTWVEVEP